MDFIEGFTVTRLEDKVILTLTNSLGEGEVFEFPVEDAMKIGLALVSMSE